MNSLVRVREYTTEVVEELKKVTWPDWPQLKNATAVVIVFVLLIALIIWIMDLGVGRVLNLILDLFAR
jgi:preprotein translocase subunit SecE